MGEVIYPKLISKLPIPVARILEEAMEANLTEVVVIGMDADGDWYFASSVPDSPSIIWQCTKTIHELHKREDEMAGE